MTQDEIIHFDIEVDGYWIVGKTLNKTTGFVTGWSKLSDEGYSKNFWFTEPPKLFLKSRYGVEIDWKQSDALGNLFETDWIDFCYLLSVCSFKADAIKLFLGPIAQMAKESGKRALNVIPNRQLLLRLLNDPISFNEKKAMLPELDEDYDIVRKRHVFAEISDNEIGAAIESCIVDNRDQWEKAKTTHPQLKNWFVGQVMKSYKGKIDASRVKHILDTQF